MYQTEAGSKVPLSPPTIGAHAEGGGCEGSYALAPLYKSSDSPPPASYSIELEDMIKYN